VVAPVEIAFDVTSTAVSVALPGVLWTVLFLLAWSHGPFADSIGLGRKVFWLLVPGALFASFAFLPITPVSYDWLAVSLAGAVFPLFVGGLALGRYAPPLGRSLGAFLGALAVMSGALFVIVLPSTAGALAQVGAAIRLSAAGAEVLLVAVVAAACSAVVGAIALRSPDRAPRAVAFLFALVSGVLVLTFAGSSAIPGLGITESFPFYLLPPLGAGLIAGLVAPRVFPREEGFALPVAFFASTFGVLLGADLLREPPLYGQGPAGLYTIGGAGVLDLVYLSGLLGLAGAYLVHRLYDRGWRPIGTPLPETIPSPVGYLARAFRSGAEGHLEESLRESSRAAHEAAAQAWRLRGAAAPPDANPWRGLPVPGWVVSDQANLDAISVSDTTDSREAYRAWLMACQLVALGHLLGYGRFASIPQRILAFTIDLLLVGGGGVAVFTLIAYGTPGGINDLLSSLSFNAAIYGFVAVAFFYFAFAEAWVGATIGKALVGIAVRDRDLRRPDRLAAFVRNAPIAPVLVCVGIGAAIAVAIAVKGLASGPSYLPGVSFSVGVIAILGITGVVVGAVALLGAFAILAILLTSERQRVGDLWAGTWVVREPTTTPPVRPAGEVPPASGGAGRSG
jgi:uncharacterized RDD family membrane protein YckC/uncharacterized membrane protein